MRSILRSAPFRIPPRPRHRPHLHRSVQSEKRGRDEHEDGELREKPGAFSITTYDFSEAELSRVGNFEQGPFDKVRDVLAILSLRKT